MRIRNGFVLRKVGDTMMVLATGAACDSFSGMITLNESGALLWRALEQDRTKQELLELMLSEYAVDASVLSCDIDRFLHTMRTHGLLDETH